MKGTFQLTIEPFFKQMSFGVRSNNGIKVLASVVWDLDNATQSSGKLGKYEAGIPEEVKENCFLYIEELENYRLYII